MRKAPRCGTTFCQSSHNHHCVHAWTSLEGMFAADRKRQRTARSSNTLMCSPRCFHGKPYTILHFHHDRQSVLRGNSPGCSKGPISLMTLTPGFAMILVWCLRAIVDERQRAGEHPALGGCGRIQRTNMRAHLCGLRCAQRCPQMIWAESQKTFALTCIGATPGFRPGQAVQPEIVTKKKFEFVSLPSRNRLLVARRPPRGRSWRRLARSRRHKLSQRRACSTRPPWADPRGAMSFFHTAEKLKHPLLWHAEQSSGRSREFPRQPYKWGRLVGQREEGHTSMGVTFRAREMLSQISTSMLEAHSATKATNCRSELTNLGIS